MTNEELDKMLEQRVKQKELEALDASAPICVEKKAVEHVVEQIPLAVDPTSSEPTEIVDGMFNQAIGHVATTDKNVQAQVLDAAKGYITNKTEAIKSEINTENKKAFFENNEDACGSYGFNEKTTPKWAVKAMRIGYNIMVALWIFVGTFTFMPVSFICKKMSVIIKNVWLAVVLSVLIWGATIIVPILVPILASIKIN